MNMPFVSFSNDEIKEGEPMKRGDKIRCPHCKGKHRIMLGTEDGKKTDALMFYRCGRTGYLAGLNGRSVMERFTKADK
jgi:DNA-directed RNA polymerase subunit RPC12/RpoP